MSTHHDEAVLIAAATVRRVAVALFAAAAALAFAGVLPGDSVLLGLSTSDSLADAGRLLAAVVLARRVLENDPARLARTLGHVGIGMLAAGALVTLDPHLFGLLPFGATLTDQGVLLAAGAAALVVARMAAARHPSSVRRPRRRAG
ncbi:hypothetical protein AAIB33_18475 [Microbacterium sp. AZCO]|uniref:hypothetical protein n=1 Tax=Microbacterium sp. AZCO TaxID=3142976 RepID=UPI0031F40A4E